MSTITALVACLACFGTLIALGISEKQKNEKYISNIPIRINVNGIRGKSTATRLITAILQEAGYKTIGKTTGTAARMIYFDTDEEKQIVRKPCGVRISEQLKVIKEAYEKGAEALVCECMAVKPEYQKVYQHQMLKGTMTVIVNVLEDHLDEMGPTTSEIAYAFAQTIPYNGVAIIPECNFSNYFKEVAEKRGSKWYVTNDNEITQEFLDRFDYKLFDHNCAVALAAARALGIDDETAYRGMLKAHADPGALRLYRIAKGAVFINGFAANEPSSSLEIWDSVQEEDMPTENPIVVLNCRPDRVDRTRQFVKDFIPKMPNHTLLVIGERTKECTDAYNAGKFPNVTEYKCIEGKSVPPIIEYLSGVMEGRCVFGVGNIHGIGNEFVDALLSFEEENKEGESL